MNYFKHSMGIFLGATLLFSSINITYAAPTSCGVNYFSETAPDILNEKLKSRTMELCHDGFGVMHSGVTATPLWSAEHLTSNRVIDAKRVNRVDRFYSETAIPSKDRSELSHYSRSGYDRGHLAPSADMDSVNSQANSFSLSNIVPQQPDLNRNLWADIESTTRALALKYDDVYVVTGVAFQGQNLKALKGRVIIPTALYKAIYIPSANAAAVWWAPNSEPGTSYEVISVNELAQRTGVDVFPQVKPEIKSIAAKMPKPRKGADRSAGKRQRTQSPQLQLAPQETETPNQDTTSTLKEIGKNLLIEAVKGALK